MRIFTIAASAEANAGASEPSADGHPQDPQLVLIGDVVVDVRRNAVLPYGEVPAGPDAPHEIPVAGLPYALLAWIRPAPADPFSIATWAVIS